MSTDDQDISIPEAAAAEEVPVAPTSGFEALKKKYAEVKEQKPEDFDIPGYDGMLVARYKILDFDSARDIGRKHRRRDDPRWMLNSQIDTLIAACIGMFYRDEAGELVPLTDNGDVVRFDERLARNMGLGEIETARGVVLAVFSNEVAIIDHHNEVMDWMRKGRKDLADLGEA